MMMTRSFATDAGSSFSPKTIEPSAESGYAFAERKSYDEFCLMISSVEQGVSDDSKMATTKPRKLSYVHSWRQRITPLDIGPPTSPFGRSEFPTSPVAVITPDQLCITSLPPYDPRTASLLARSPTSDSLEQTIVGEPTNFYDLYDAQLEQMIDDACEQSSSDSSSTISAGMYIPQAVPSIIPPRVEKPRSRTVSSAIRWLPARIKYTILSTGSAVHRAFRR